MSARLEVGYGAPGCAAYCLPPSLSQPKPYQQLGGCQGARDASLRSGLPRLFVARTSIHPSHSGAVSLAGPGPSTGNLTQNSAPPSSEPATRTSPSCSITICCTI